MRSRMFTMTKREGLEPVNLRIWNPAHVHLCFRLMRPDLSRRAIGLMLFLFRLEFFEAYAAASRAS